MNTGDKNQLKTMSMIIIAYNLIASIPVLILSADKLHNELGLLLGMAMALGMLFHMHSVIARSFYYEGNKKALFIRNSILRYVMVGVLLALAGITGWASPIFALVGMLSLKVSAYLQPLFAKVVGIKK